MSKAAVRPVAHFAVQAQAALAQAGDILGGDGVIRQQTGQQQVMAGGGIIVLGTTLIPLLSTLF